MTYLGYTKNTWANGRGHGQWAPGATALQASWFQNIEDGIEALYGRVLWATDYDSPAAALAAAQADSQRPTVVFTPGVYTNTTAMTPFTGMRMVALGGGSEFGYNVRIVNSTTDMFTPTADVSDIHIEGIQFQGDTTNIDTNWWTNGTGYQILYSHIDKCGFTSFKRIYHGNWTGVTFENFYSNAGDSKIQVFDVGGADNIFGPGFLGSSGGLARTTLTASVTSGASPKTISVADATSAVIGNPVYISPNSNGSSSGRDISIISGISGNDLTVGTLASAHSAGEYVHIITNTPMVELSMSHSLINRLYISPGPGMALHVTGGHSSVFFNCELSGAPAHSAGPGLYCVGAQGHQFIGCNVSSVAEKGWAQFNGAVVIYDSVDLSFVGSLVSDVNSFTPNLWRFGRSGGGGVLLTDRIRITGTTYYNISGTAVTMSGNAAMTAADRTINFDEFPIVKAGAPTDADFFSLAHDGLTCTDTTNNRLYSRSGGVWRYAALT